MSKKQSRRSVSISGAVYEKLKAHCVKEERSMSGMVEYLLRDHLGMEQRTATRKLETPAVEVIKTVDVASVHLMDVEVVRTVATAPVHVTAKPANGKHVGHCPVPERTYGLNDAERAARKVAISEADSRRAGNIFSF